MTEINIDAVYQGKVDLLSLVIKNERGDVVKIDKVLRNTTIVQYPEIPEVILLHGYLESNSESKSVIVKLYNANDHKIDFNNYKMFVDAGIPMFWYDITYSLYTNQGEIDENAYVLVMEELLPITDNAMEMLTQLIPVVFKYRSFCCHSDIKPLNIMKSESSLESESSFKYYFIDLDDISTEKCLYGFKRTTYTPLFASQSKTYINITTIKQDLIELIGTAFKIMFPNSDIDYISAGRYKILYPLYMIVYNINEHNITDLDEQLIMKVLYEIINDSQSKPICNYILEHRCNIHMTNEEMLNLMC